MHSARGKYQTNCFSAADGMGLWAAMRTVSNSAVWGLLLGIKLYADFQTTVSPRALILSASAPVSIHTYVAFAMPVIMELMIAYLAFVIVSVHGKITASMHLIFTEFTLNQLCCKVDLEWLRRLMLRLLGNTSPQWNRSFGCFGTYGCLHQLMTQCATDHMTKLTM